MGAETEVKLRLDRAGLDALRRHPLIRKFKTGRAATQFQTSLYFDTPELALLHRRIALRIRHAGGARIQTVKTAAGAGGWTRGEWENPVESDTPDLAAIAAPDIRALLTQESIGGSLAPIFSTEISRTRLHLVFPDGVVELALDEGRIAAGQKTEPVCEAELELKSGVTPLLFQTALALAADIPCHLSIASKAERGYALADDAVDVPVKAGRVALTANMPRGEAFQRIAHSCLAQILANQDVLARTGAPESVHQMRVGIRRLRSAMTLFRDLLDGPETDAITAEIRWLQGHLSPARDRDVFIAEILDPLVPLMGGDPGFDALYADFQTEQQALSAIVRQVLDMPRHTKLMLTLALWIEAGAWRNTADMTARARLDQPLGPLADAVLNARDRKVRKSLRHLERLPPAQRHAARIQVKKLRYALDFFAPLYPPARIEPLSALYARLQDRLGLLNDIAIGQDLLRQRAEAAQNAAGLWAAGRIAGWHESHAPALIKDAARIARKGRRAPRPWPKTERRRDSGGT
ncbi:MAG: CHAD domain-containing protein [Rhodospirillaceae bacterium]|nr:CHAD domain-containing protein [Rhodospirillaceae bacterium]